MVTMRTVGGEGLPAEFGGALRAARLAAGVSLEALAGRVGCAKSYLSAMENGVKGPPSAEVVERLEAGLGLGRGVLRARADWGRTPGEVKRDFGAMRAREREARALASMLREGARGGSLDQMFKSGALRGLIERVAPERAEGAVRGACVEALAALLPVEIPVINKVTAGYPAGFTDLDYPARVADEYIRAPDVHDPDAFAARVVGDSMMPDYREGDIVVFSPALEVKSGMDCFVRLEPDHESTFKRVYFEAGEGGAELIRIQPINEAYPARVVERERVAGLYAGVSVVRAIQSGK
jgi:repressor LexA